MLELRDAELQAYKDEKQLELEEKRQEIHDRLLLETIENAELRAFEELRIEEEKELALVEMLEDSEELKLLIHKKYEIQRAELRKKLADAETKATEAKQKTEQEQQKQALGAVKDTLGEIGGMMKEGSEGWKAIKTAEAMISMIMSAQKAYEATVGIPIVGPVLAPINAGIAVAAGMLNIQKIQQTKIPDAPSFAGGGFTGPGFGSSDSTGHRPAGIVHQDEWVAPTWMLREPLYADTISMLDNARVNRFAVGGFSTPVPSPSQPDSKIVDSTFFDEETTKTNDSLMFRIADTLDRLDEKLDQDFFAKISFDELEESQKEVEEIRREASL